MKNIEKHFDKLKDILEKSGSMHCPIYCFRTGNSDCSGLSCDDCFIESLAWLNEEYHEPIKLTKFEYDLLKTNDQSHQRSIGSYKTYVNMKNAGYYNGIKCWDMPIESILNHCEVVE